MTADIELLPSSVAAFTEALKGERGSLDAWLEVNDEREVAAHVEAYTRANVAHATAAKDAEIEALRAEVRDLRKRQAGWERHVAAAGCEYVRDGEHDALVNRRAERLAEALQRALEAVRDTLQQSYQNAGQECCGRGGMQECCGEPEPVWAPEDQAVMDKLAPIERLLSAALRDHDQEGKDG